VRLVGSLSFRIFTAALLILSVLTLVSGLIIFGLDRRTAEATAQRDALNLRDQLVLSLEEAVWNFSNSQVEVMLAVAMQDSRVAYIAVWNHDGSLFAGFDRLADESGYPVAVTDGWVRPETSDRVLYAQLEHKDIALGVLEIGLLLDPVIRKINRDLFLFSLRGLLVSVVSLLVLVFYVKMSLIDAISHLNTAVHRIGAKDFGVRVGNEIKRQDEIGQLARNLNEMAAVFQAYSSDLESLVSDRTSRLIDAEKLAFLGGLTTGVAHEINTPVGIGVTAASHLQELLKQVRQNLESGQLTRSAIENFFNESDETVAILLLNLQRASNFVSSFKKVTADQSNEDRRLVKLCEYVGEVLFSLRPRLKSSPHLISVDIPVDLAWYGYPGMLSQIVSNLLVNSLNHAYPDQRAGAIELKARIQNKDIVLEYRDDGIGIPTENLNRIFQPFFTTKREQGGTGLGLYIVYNIVSKLGGTITCDSTLGDGVHFRLVLPQQNDETNEVDG